MTRCSSGSNNMDRLRGDFDAEFFSELGRDVGGAFKGREALYNNKLLDLVSFLTGSMGGHERRDMKRSTSQIGPMPGFLFRNHPVSWSLFQNGASA